MGANCQPAIRNCEAFREYIIQDYLDNKSSFKHEYSFINYYGSKVDESKIVLAKYHNEGSEDVLVADLLLPLYDDINQTYEKTVSAYKYITEYYDFDWVVRINISLFINLYLLDKVVDKLDKKHIYCNSINSYINANDYTNHLYPRGDCYIISQENIKGALKYSDDYFINLRRNNAKDREKLIKAMTQENIEHVDDTLFGICLIKHLGSEYFKHYNLLNYLYRGDIVDEDKDLGLDDRYKYCLTFRVKTVPPGETYSGYSWYDNKYRTNDVVKFKKLSQEIKKYFYDEDHITLKDLIVSKKKGKHAIYVIYDALNIADFEKSIKKKDERRESR